MPECEKYMDLIGVELDGELSDAEKAELHAHLEICDNCRRYRDALLAVEDALANDLAEPPATLAKSVMARVEAMSAHGSVKKTKKTNRVRLLRSIRSASLAAVAVFAIWAGVNVFSPKGADKSAATAAAPAAMDMAAEAAPAETMLEDGVSRAMGMAEPAANSPAEAALPMEAPAEAPMPMAPDTEESVAYSAEFETAARVDVYRQGEWLFTSEDAALWDFVQTKLLTANEPAERPDADADYALALFYPGGAVEQVSLWLSGDNVYWQFDGEETAFRSSATPTDLRLWIEE